MNILWTRICFDLLKITTKFLTCLNLNYMLKHKIETKKTYSQLDQILVLPLIQRQILSLFSISVIFVL